MKMGALEMVLTDVGQAASTAYRVILSANVTLGLHRHAEVDFGVRF